MFHLHCLVFLNEFLVSHILWAYPNIPAQVFRGQQRHSNRKTNSDFPVILQFEMSLSVHMYHYWFTTIISEKKQFISIFCQYHTLRKCIWILKYLFPGSLREVSGRHNEMRLGDMFQIGINNILFLLKMQSCFLFCLRPGSTKFSGSEGNQTR